MPAHPDGRGKTLVACEAVAIGVKDLLQKDRALILWLVPSNTIRSQTLARLKDGWDCPWAYVLFSVAEMGASRAVEQILGRVLRMPKAKRKQRDDLNNAYAFVASTKFGEAAKALKDGLIASGFEGQDAGELVVERQFLPGTATVTPKVPETPVTMTLPDKPTTALPLTVLGAVTWDEKSGELTVETPLTMEQEEAVVNWVPTAQAKAAVRAAVNQRAGLGAAAGKARTCPAERGVLFAVPVLALKQGDFLHQFEEDDSIERNNWTLSNCDKSFQVTMNGETHEFDSFECAIEALAPRCAHCDCRIIGHGVETDGRMFCCAHCAEHEGGQGLRDRSDHAGVAV